MPFNGNRTANAKTWFCLNPDQALSAIVFQNEGPRSIEVKLNGSATVPPTNRDGTLTYQANEAMGADETFANRFPGVSAPGFLWAISEESVTVSVSY